MVSAKDLCFRCGLRVYPVEKIDVGVILHRRCFKCKQCNIQLTLRTFYHDKECTSEIYCNVHIPKLVGTINQDSLSIQSAMNTPKRNDYTNDQIRNSGASGWQYDAHALEFEHLKGLQSRKRTRQNFLDYHAFNEIGVFDAQGDLEKIQKAEEDKLYLKLSEERKRHLEQFHTSARLQSKEERLPECVTENANLRETDIHDEASELHSCVKAADGVDVDVVLEKLLEDEKTEISTLIEKHSQEMLSLISEKIMDTQKTDDEFLRLEDIHMNQSPAVAPPEQRRLILRKDPSLFNNLDKSIIETSKRDHTTFTELVKDLTKDCLTELEKARSLFLWVTLKDLNIMEMDKAFAEGSPNDLLRGVKYGTESYHVLYKRLCSYAGLFCAIVHGYSKGGGYKPGMDVQQNQFRNSWTAVSIDGNWQFINCKWGARHVKVVSGSQNAGEASDSDQELHYKFDEFYFITDPEDHIFQHFPDDPSWQLLECPITLTDFIELPVIKSPFFNMNLHFSQYYECDLHTEDGITEISLNFEHTVVLGSVLESAEHEGREPCENRVLLRFSGNAALFTVAPPHVGRFYFTIFGKIRQTDSFKSLCSFNVICDACVPSNNCFPNLSCIGPVPSSSHCILTPITYVDPLICWSGEDLTLEFKVTEELDIQQTFHLFISNTAKTYSYADESDYSFRESSQFDKTIYRLRFRKSGFYVFSLNVSSSNSEQSGKRVYECVFRYLIKCSGPISVLPKRLPRARHGWRDCRLIEPMNGELPRDTHVLFKIYSPKSCYVVAVIDESWHNLKGIDGEWQGRVATGNRSCKLKVYSKSDLSTSRYSPLLEFSVI